MYSKTPDILAFPSTNKQAVLSQSQLDALKAGTLRLLKDAGVRFPSPKAIEIFADHGADVDMDTQIVRIAPDLEEFNRINQTHQPEPLPEEKLAELDRILASAEREAERLH